MKDFISKNWFKLMIGLSVMMFSFGFMINSISPSYSNSSYMEIEPTISTNGIEFEDGTLFVDGGCKLPRKLGQSKVYFSPDKRR